MLVKGRWREFPDEIKRPIIEAQVLTAAGVWKAVAFQLDGGADRTVLEARLLPWLTPLVVPASQMPRVGGVGGLVGITLADTRLGFTRDDGGLVTVNGPFAVFTEAESCDISILGRDVTDNFDVIYSWPKREVLLLAPPHTYVTQLPF